MKVQATLKNLRIAPRKVRLVTHSLIGVDTGEALLQLSKQVKKSSQPISKLLKSALANATHNNGLHEDNLYVSEIRVGDGPRLKRWLPRAFGRATPLIRRGSNVTIILEERIEGKDRTMKKKDAPTVIQGALTEKEEKEIPKVSKAVKPEMKKELGKGVKPVAGKVVKKMFQRKSV